MWRLGCNIVLEALEKLHLHDHEVFVPRDASLNDERWWAALKEVWLEK